MGELSFATLLAEAERLVAADEVEAPELLAFATQARELGPQLAREDLGELLEAYGRVQERIRAEHAALKERIGHAGSGRRALKGYGSLRSKKVCQRAFTRL